LFRSFKQFKSFGRNDVLKLQNDVLKHQNDVLKLQNVVPKFRSDVFKLQYTVPILQNNVFNLRNDVLKLQNPFWKGLVFQAKPGKEPTCGATARNDLSRPPGAATAGDAGGR
jgi:hypothetical protein